MTRETLLVRLPAETKKGLIQLAQERGVTVNGLVNYVLWKLIKQKGDHHEKGTGNSPVD